MPHPVLKGEASKHCIWSYRIVSTKFSPVIQSQNRTSQLRSISLHYHNKQRDITYLTLVPTIWVPDICDKFHFRWPERVIFGKCQMSFKHTTFTVNKKTEKNLFKVSRSTKGTKSGSQYNITHFY